jgi:hypothetical protein
VSRSFQRFFNADALEKIINSKADTKRVERLLGEKATHGDIQNCLKVVKNLFDRIYQMSVLQVETSRSLVPTKSSSSSINIETTQAK